MVMARVKQKTVTAKIFENILFLAEAFADKNDEEIPNVPVLELARCFELSHPRVRRLYRRRSKLWPLWK